MNRGPFNDIPADNEVPPLPAGFALDPHPAQQAQPQDSTVPPLPAGFTADAPSPGLDNAPAERQLVQADQLSADDTAALQQLYHTGSADEIRAFLHARGRVSQPGLDEYIAKRTANPASVGYDPSYVGKPVETTGLGAFARGADQGLTLGLGDEAHGFLNGVTSLLSGGGYTDAYNKTVDSDRAQLGQDSQEHGLASIAGNIAGGAVLPFGLAKAGLTPALEAVALKAGQEAVAAGASADAAKVIAARAVARQMAIEGAGYGGVYGGASAEGGPGQRLTGAAIGAGEGAAGGALLGALGVRSAAKTADAAGAAPTAGQEVYQAGQRQGIDVLPADVGGPATRRLTAAAAQAPLSAAPVITAAQNMVGQAQTARDRIASAIGQALDPEGAGLAVRAGAQKYIASSGADVRNAYAAAERAAGDTRVTPTNALANLDQHIAELGGVPGGAPALGTLTDLRDALAQGDVSPANLLRMRTNLRDQFMQDGLRGSDTERRVGQVLDAAQTDIADGLRDAGKPQAAALYAAAAAKYKARVNTIDNVLKPLIGTREAPRSGEAVVKTLTADLQGNQARAVKLLRTLPPEERATTQASIIGALGNQGAGAQNAAGDGFSLSQFLTHWNKIGETAKSAYFGTESRAALNDLAKVADGAKQAQGYANRSNTAGGVWGNIGALAGGAAVSPVAAAIGGITQYAGGRLLASPRFARWLARAPRTALSDTSYIERLTRIARAEPAIAGEIGQFQQRLTDSISSAPNRAAAQQSGANMGIANGQDAQQQPEYQGTAPRSHGIGIPVYD